MNCIFCHSEEKSEPAKAEAIVCSWCIKTFLQAPPSQIEAAYSKAVELGFQGKAEILETFMKEGEIYVRETGKARSDMVRERPVRQARSARYEIRA